MEVRVEEHEPNQMVRNGQLQHALQATLEVHFGERRNTVLHQRDHPLLAERDANKRERDQLKLRIGLATDSVVPR